MAPVALPRSLLPEISEVPKNKETGARSGVVCGSEGRGFEFHPSSVGFFSPDRLLSTAGAAVGQEGSLGTQLSYIHFTGCGSHYLTSTAGAAAPGPG